MTMGSGGRSPEPRRWTLTVALKPTALRWVYRLSKLEFQVAREKLIPPTQDADDDTRKPHERFEDLAARLMRVPKAEVDKREREWLQGRKP